MKLEDIETFQSLSENQCIDIQNRLKPFISYKNKLSLTDINRVCGVDIAYWNKGSIEYGVCYAVIIDVVTKQIIEKQNSISKISFPYIPGCLAFRELPLVIETLSKITSLYNIVMFDGNGVLHPRRMGIATHASFYLGCPTVGVAKTYYKISDTELNQPLNEVGSYSDILDNGEIVGRSIRTHKDVKPVFVSVGNHIDIDTATQLVLSLTDRKSHIPIPTRYADIETHLMRELYKNDIRYTK